MKKSSTREFKKRSKRSVLSKPPPFIFRSEGEDLNPDNFECIFSYDIMKDPVTTATGNSYEKSQLYSYLLKDNRDPISRTPIYRDEVYPNHALKKAIEYYKQSKLVN